MMKGRFSKPVLGGIIAAFTIIAIIAVFQHKQERQEPSKNKYYRNYVTELLREDNLLDVRNETLGFEKIYVIGLPERTDKRDAFSLQASLTDIHFEWLDGVKGEKVADKAIPQFWPSNAGKGATLGCWRGHMNAIQKMVQEEVATALLFEDDADWDIMLKEQLVEFARGTRYLQNSTGLTFSPYGDNWDVLWVGQCISKNNEQVDQKYYVIRDDPTVAPPELREEQKPYPNLSPPALSGNFTRIVHEPYYGRCTFGYAISLRGAQKLLYHQGLSKDGTTIDRGINRFCSRRDLGARCYAPYPGLVGTHKAAGDTTKDSDRVNTGGKVRDKGVTEHIVYSTRLNFKNILLGKQPKSQWPNQTMYPKLNDSVMIPRGHGTFVHKNQFVIQHPK
ncbi:Procollagen galactosyltransferase 1 [Phlyctema vagabunda]|uniref:Procollagen galactosyltransferase 1 n=1 Tax=Phlyctema vagabunda TaxID=108571 RepID=A0ABR4P9R3_9HELO